PDVSLGQLPQLATLLAHPKVVAVGETGLDYFRDARENPALRQQQRDLFLAHLQLANEHRLPVIIHNRDSDADMLQILEAHARTLPNDRRPR
ncbi:MAG: TatD family hydrolase, partial [Verrucomicrobiae bacterium]|nr:TatD family hydrolase [Verrucomicrobiae bacterium]